MLKLLPPLGLDIPTMLPFPSKKYRPNPGVWPDRLPGLLPKPPGFVEPGVVAPVDAVLEEPVLAVDAVLEPVVAVPVMPEELLPAVDAVVPVPVVPVMPVVPLVPVVPPVPVVPVPLVVPPVVLVPPVLPVVPVPPAALFSVVSTVLRFKLEICALYVPVRFALVQPVMPYETRGRPSPKPQKIRPPITIVLCDGVIE
jgi:hypothetical protein